MNEKESELLRTEISVLRLVKHPNLIRLYDVFETSDAIFLVMELVTGGELYEHIVGRASPVSVGFVLDYDIFLLGRVFEFRTEGYSTSDALILGLEHTGGIITTAGIIMVSAFLALLMSSNPVVVQLGFQLSIAVLVDTFLIRTFFVPALMQIGVEWNWWPKKMPKVTKKM